MSHYVVIYADGDYLYPRRPLGNRYPDRYTSRSSWGEDFSQARVFTSKSAGTNSATAAGAEIGDFEVVEVCLTIVRDEDYDPR